LNDYVDLAWIHVYLRKWLEWEPSWYQKGYARRRRIEKEVRMDVLERAWDQVRSSLIWRVKWN